MSTTTARRTTTEIRPNAVAIGMRQAKGWSQVQLAEEFERTFARLVQAKALRGAPPKRSAIVKEISRVESGRIAIPDDMYLRLWCEAFGCDAAELFGHLDAPVLDKDGRATFAVTSHKFVPAYLGCDGISAIRDLAETADGQWVTCWRAGLQHPNASADVYVWPFGVAVTHIVEHLEFASLGQLAVWRRNSYPLARAWADHELGHLVGAEVETPYTLSAYWLTRPKWSGDQLDTAMRLLSMPSVLLDREEEAVDEDQLLSGAEQVERALLRDGTVDRADLMPFGSRGVSIGYASWSGVAYHPVAPRRALSVNEMVSCELLVQAIWCYTHEIQRQVETGRDPVVPVEYGWRFLRGIRSRLTAPRPVESGQHAGMRDAVLATSGLSRQMESAIDALRESERGI
jgi:transcriptional regulator with XRE-family HTH domain